jgi:PqqD family protein of HPr-rel-A system
VPDPRPAESPRARFEAVDGLRLCILDDDVVVFDPLSWDAHLLNPAARAVLELLLEAPQSESEVEAFLRDVLQPGEQSQAATHARKLIGELQSLGVVRVVSERAC